MKVLAAMSGGVDSAVAAARAVDAGHDVTGVHLALAENPTSFRTGARGCCTLEDARDARRAADVLGIPFYVWDLADRFRAEVVDDFVAEYAAGRTPNPCLRCNEKIKFTAVLDRAMALGFDAVVTGHHARLDGGRLRRSVDSGKDQSYVLAVLTAEQLARAILPLGDSTKVEVRAEAARRGLLVADKPDSHDTCFIADGDTAGFLRSRLGSRPGEIVDDESGAVVGRHDGAYAYTVGQRKGLHIGTPAADGKPRYVLDISPVDNRVTVGPAAALAVDEVRADRAVWSGRVANGAGADGAGADGDGADGGGADRDGADGDGADGEGADGAFECLVQLRAHGLVSAATVSVCGAEVVAQLHEPQHGIAAGQAMVFYGSPTAGTVATAADLVLGSATITATRRTPPAPATSRTQPAAAATSTRPGRLAGIS